MDFPDSCGKCELWTPPVGDDTFYGKCVNSCASRPEPPRPLWCPLSPRALTSYEQAGLDAEREYLRNRGILKPYVE